ncbi:hypothetical protein CsSME_00026669 [Camellia sinensis var. sinensis]
MDMHKNTEGSKPTPPDLISNLPDCLLCSILLSKRAFFPTGGDTMAVSLSLAFYFNLKRMTKPCREIFQQATKLREKKDELAKHLLDTIPITGDVLSSQTSPVTACRLVFFGGPLS